MGWAGLGLRDPPEYKAEVPKLNTYFPLENSYSILAFWAWVQCPEDRYDVAPDLVDDSRDFLAV